MTETEVRWLSRRERGCIMGKSVAYERALRIYDRASSEPDESRQAHLLGKLTTKLSSITLAAGDRVVC